MIINICFGTRDLETAGRFYDAVTAELGVARTNTTERSIYYGSSGNGITFAVTLPFDGNAAGNGNGTMATLGAPDRATVDKLHAAAMANGGSDEGGPGVRDNGYYVAYWRDPDGNKMNAVSLGG
jgi:catechol 2,3-dioxygenase-like lactoylglutathione lyase family enzyme